MCNKFVYSQLLFSFDDDYDDADEDALIDLHMFVCIHMIEEININNNHENNMKKSMFIFLQILEYESQ